jgi:hypothetical protein
MRVHVHPCNTARTDYRTVAHELESRASYLRSRVTYACYARGTVRFVLSRSWSTRLTSHDDRTRAEALELSTTPNTLVYYVLLTLLPGSKVLSGYSRAVIVRESHCLSNSRVVSSDYILVQPSGCYQSSIQIPYIHRRDALRKQCNQSRHEHVSISRGTLLIQFRFESDLAAPCSPVGESRCVSSAL